VRHLLDHFVPQKPAQPGADLRKLLSATRRNWSPLEEIADERQECQWRF
jgi:hypothetical protein